MPLSPPTPRDVMHTRRITLNGYSREDGQIDVEAHLVDTKAIVIDNVDRGHMEPGEHLHEMWVRLTVDENMVVTACEAVTEYGPYFACAGGAATMDRLVGLTIKAGFLKAANERLGGTQGCTHLREMLQQIATVSLQTLWPVRSRREAAALARGEAPQKKSGDGATRMLNTCHAYASDGAVVQRRWPQLYTGPATRTGTD